MIDKSRAAQLIIQNAILVKQNRALQAKENKKEEQCTKLFADGFGRHLTNLELIQTTAMEKQKRQDEEAQKAQRRADREVDALRRAALEVQWEKVKADHKKAMEVWKAECGRLKAEGAQVKDLPMKPKRALKPKLAVRAAAVLPEGEEEQELSSSSEEAEEG